MNHSLQHGFESASSDGVNTFEWLVEEEHSGTVDDGGGEGKFFLHAVREVGDELFRLICQLHEVEELSAAAVCGVAVETIHAADEAQIFGCGETREQRHSFGDDSDLAFEVESAGVEGLAEDLDVPGGGLEQAGEHFDGCGLSCSIRAEEAEELARRDLKGNIVNCGEAAEAAGADAIDGAAAKAGRVYPNSHIP